MRPRPDKKRRRGQRDLSLPFQELRFEVGTPDHGRRLDSFLVEALEWGSRTRVCSYIDDGMVEVLPHKDPQRATIAAMKVGLKLRVGQEVVVQLPQPGASVAQRAAAALDDEVELSSEVTAMQVIYE